MFTNLELGQTVLPNLLLVPSQLHTAKSVILSCLLIFIPLLLRYLLYWLAYHVAYLRRREKQRPPTLPHFIPLLGSTIPFAFDCLNFFKNATRYAGSLAPVKISVMSGDIFLFQGPNAVAEIWKQSQLSSPIFIFTFGLEHMFGMPKRALAPYRADDSGPQRRPHPESNVAPHNRVDHLTHLDLSRAYGGANLNKAFTRCADALKRNLAKSIVSTDSWEEKEDLLGFFQENLGAAMIEGMYGSKLCELSPGFIDDIWLFDTVVTKFAKLVPRFLHPESYRVRGRLLSAIRRWHSHAKENFDQSHIGPDGDSDPYWGSQLMRSRQEVLLKADNQDEEAIAATDLGLIWATLTNTVPSSMFCSFHILRDVELRDRVCASLGDALDAKGWNVDMEKVLSNPLLSSIYAESLRLHTQLTITRCSPHSNIELASWFLPKNKVCMVSSYVSHMDENFWNIRDGKYPIDSFWAERFLIDPLDPNSGPVRNDVPSSVYQRPSNAEEERGVFFSVKGLEGAWIPYGGGHAACPGRHLAKRLIFYTTCLLLAAFDIEILTQEVVMDSPRFGLGMQRPRQPIRFRIKRKTSALVD
ncbi:cytochrome P450 [Xylaria cf. heliscus]|nr:cytochrome P450 [Xylaria cf. heliscus]